MVFFQKGHQLFGLLLFKTCPKNFKSPCLNVRFVMPNQWGLMLDGKGMAEINSLISVSQIGRKISLTRGTPSPPPSWYWIQSMCELEIIQMIIVGGLCGRVDASQPRSHHFKSEQTKRGKFNIAFNLCNRLVWYILAKNFAYPTALLT